MGMLERVEESVEFTWFSPRKGPSIRGLSFFSLSRSILSLFSWLYFLSLITIFLIGLVKFFNVLLPIKNYVSGWKRKNVPTVQKLLGEKLFSCFRNICFSMPCTHLNPTFSRNHDREGTTTGGIEKVFEGSSSSGGGSQQLWERERYREESGNMCKQWGIEHIVLAWKASCMCEGEIARQFKNIYCCFYHSTHFRPYRRIVIALTTK